MVGARTTQVAAEVRAVLEEPNPAAERRLGAAVAVAVEEGKVVTRSGEETHHQVEEVRLDPDKPGLVRRGPPDPKVLAGEVVPIPAVPEAVPSREPQVVPTPEARFAPIRAVRVVASPGARELPTDSLVRPT